MKQKSKLLLGLGAAAALLTTPIVVSGCKTADGHVREDNTMMKKGRYSDRSNKLCGCGKKNEECACKNDKGGSCGGDKGGSCGEGSCGEGSCGKK